TAADRILVTAIKKTFIHKNFIIKSDPKTINEDPTRRYFETNLAYNVLLNNAEKLDHDYLKIFTQNLKKRLYFLPNASADLILKVEKIVYGDIDNKLLNKYELEYAQLSNKLLNTKFYGLSAKACSNLYEIACSTILATLLTQYDKSMPVDIYSDSIFTMGMDGRGRIVKSDNDEVRTTSKGLMKSSSPVPLYDDLVNSRDTSPFQRSADQANFMLESPWSHFLFSRQTQLYSNGISSTTLAQIRTMVLQKRLGNPYPSSNFQIYWTLFAGLMIYNSGGHSFFEIFEVFKLPLFQELLSKHQRSFQALEADKLMHQWLSKDQKNAFELALQSTQIYMHTVLNKKILLSQFKKQFHLVDFTYLSTKIDLHQAVIETDIQTFTGLIKNIPRKNINILNKEKWSALMVAAQLGKTEHGQLLLSKGADIRIRVGGLAALELAIKSQQFNTIVLLLKAGSVIKIGTKGLLKERAPAVYLACRQHDIHILRLLLNRENGLNIHDIKEAILVALKVENLDGIVNLIKHTQYEEREQYFSRDYKELLLREAVKSGNIRLIQSIMIIKNILDHDVNSFSGITDYSELLNIATEQGFVPVTKFLLEHLGFTKTCSSVSALSIFRSSPNDFRDQTPIQASGLRIF
ncbi:MAG: ankyrin repeat domain-containing protein, partial [bacterium]|nr:ankyrin repeat domain-containing protein [bacterium]